MRLFCKTILGEILTLEVAGDSFALEVMRKIEVLKGIPIDMQRIIFDSKNLFIVNDRLLETK